MRYEKRRNLRAGFTLIEMLAVITIIALLVGAVTGSAFLIIHSARLTRYNATGAALKTALNTYRTEYGQWPIPVSASSITPGGIWGVTNTDNYKVFDMLQTGNANANPRGIRFMDYNTVLTLPSGSGQRMSLFQFQQKSGGTLPTGNPLVYVTAAGQTAYFTVNFDFSTDTATVSPPDPTYTNGIAYPVRRDDGF